MGDRDFNTKPTSPVNADDVGNDVGNIGNVGEGRSGAGAFVRPLMKFFVGSKISDHLITQFCGGRMNDVGGILIGWDPLGPPMYHDASASCNWLQNWVLRRPCKIITN